MDDWKDILNEKIQERMEYYGSTNVRIAEQLQKIVGMIESGEEFELVLAELINMI